MIAVVCTAAAADSVSCSCPSSEVLPDTRTVPKKPELPVIVVVPPTAKFPVRVVFPTIVTVPPT